MSGVLNGTLPSSSAPTLYDLGPCGPGTTNPDRCAPKAQRCCQGWGRKSTALPSVCCVWQRNFTPPAPHIYESRKCPSVCQPSEYLTPSMDTGMGVNRLFFLALALQGAFPGDQGPRGVPRGWNWAASLPAARCLCRMNMQKTGPWQSPWKRSNHIWKYKVCKIYFQEEIKNNLKNTSLCSQWALRTCEIIRRDQDDEKAIGSEKDFEGKDDTEIGNRF